MTAVRIEVEVEFGAESLSCAAHVDVPETMDGGPVEPLLSVAYRMLQTIADDLAAIERGRSE